MKKYSRVYAEINLDAIKENIEQMRRHIGPDKKITAVVKTDGYGHGAEPVAQMLEPLDYIWGFAAATCEEALLLRKAGIQKPILLLGVTFPEQYEAVVKEELRPIVFKEQAAIELSKEAVRQKKNVYFHLKIDTGMNRLGFSPTKESVKIIQNISELPNVVLEGVSTHFAKADETDKSFTNLQLHRFEKMTELLKEQGIAFSMTHCSASAGIIEISNQPFDMVRAGISMYGLYPSKEVCKENVLLKPALELKSRVIFVKEIEKGETVSYGGTFEAPHKMKIATIPVGYGDGYARSLSNKGYVLIHGQRANILGRICMDQFMVDVTSLKDVSEGDVATLIGRDGDAFLPIEALADLSGRFHYEFLCDLGKRIPRVYIKEGKAVQTKDYF